MRYMLLFSVALSLCSCGKTQYITLCPKPVDYSEQSQSKLQQELEHIPQDSQIVHYLIDYKKQRDMLKICHSGVN